MFTEKHFPAAAISAEELDAYLDRGWYRMGQIVFTCHFLFFEEQLYSPVWTRLPLKGYSFRKSLRKILRKNDEAFTTFIRPGIIDGEKEALFQLYSSNFKGQLAPSVKNSLLDNADFTVFNTYEVAVYKGRQLVAFSFFDLGEKSIASIKGIYHPAFSRHSLGLYTMLKEINFGLENGFGFFYPGYIVPGYERFDYKLRIGKTSGMEFYELKSRSWKPFGLFDENSIPVRVLVAKLTEIGRALTAGGVVAQMMYYPAHDANIFGYDQERFLESPLFLNCFNHFFQSPRFIVFYDIWKEKFVFCHCMPQEDLAYYLDYSIQFDFPHSRHFLDFLLKKSLIVETDNVEEVVRWAQLISRLIGQPVQRSFMK